MKAQSNPLCGPRALQGCVSALLAALLLFAALAAPSAALAGMPGAFDAVGTDVSGFSTTDIFGAPVDGGMFGECELTVLHYFAVWDPNSIREMTYMQELADSYSPDKLRVAGLLFEDGTSTPEACAALMAQNGFDYTCLRLDETLSALVNQYHLLPQTFFVNGDGVVIRHFPGQFQNATQLKEIVQSLIGSQQEYHTVRFVDGLTGDLILRVSVAHGEDAVPPVPPTHPGYIFNRWEGDYSNVTEDRRIRALYSVDQSYYAMGDVNMDGVINSSDALLVLRFALGLTISDGIVMFGDMNDDGKVDIEDSVLILRTALHLI